MRNFLQHVKYKDDDITGIAAVEIFRVLWKAGRMKISDLVDKAEGILDEERNEKSNSYKNQGYFGRTYKHGYIHDVPKIIGSMDIEENGCDTRKNLRKGVKLSAEDRRRTKS